jgi:hypothetical protein
MLRNISAFSPWARAQKVLRRLELLPYHPKLPTNAIREAAIIAVPMNKNLIFLLVIAS